MKTQISEAERKRQALLNFKRKRLELEMEILAFWSPHAGQVPVVRALFREFKRYIFLQCGRKFGKTDFTIFVMYLYAILFQNSQIYYIADTMKHAGELLWATGRLQRFFLTPKKRRDETREEFAKRKTLGKALHEKYVDKANNSEMRLTFKNGSYIKIDGAENYANADGIEPDLMVYDEFKSHDPRYHEAMEPNLRVKKAPLLIVGTPPEELETYYEKIANQFKKLPYAAHFKRPSYLNTALYPLGEKDPEFIEECEKYDARGDEDVKMRELYAEIVVSGSKAIFPMLELPDFDYQTEKYVGHSKHIRPHEELMKIIQHRNKDWEYFSIYDPGSVKCFGNLIAAVNRYDKRVFLLDEIYETDQRKTTTRQIWPVSMEKVEDICPYEHMWDFQYDHAASWFAGEVLDNYGISLTPCTKDLKKKENKLSLIKDLLISGQLQISDRCVKMAWEMTHYRKDERGNIPKENDHLIDCLRYLLNAAHYDFNDVSRPVEIEDERRALTMDEDIRDYFNKTNGRVYLEESYGE